MKSRMSTIIPIVIESILNACDTKVNMEDAIEEQGPAEFDLDSDSEGDDDMMIGLDLDGVDEQTSAIHCLGNLSLNCSVIMQPYLPQICEKFSKLGGYIHENIRYHICLSYTQIAFGLLRMHLGKQDSDEKLDWVAGLPA